MRQLVLTLTLMITVSLGYANSPVGSIIEEINNNSVSFEIPSDYSEAFVSVVYESNTDNINIKTIDQIAFLKVVDADKEVEFEMPIMASNVHLFVNDFDKGEYQVLMTIDGVQVSTTMVIK